MVVTEYAKFLNVSENEFTGQSGDKVKFYKVGIIPTSDNKPIELVCTRDVFESAYGLSAYDDVMVGVEVFERRGYVKVRCNFLGTDRQ